MADWLLIASDLSGNVLGEITNAKDRRLEFLFNRVDTASFKIRIDHPLSDALLIDDCLVKAYRNGVLRFHGPVVSAEEAATSDAQTLQVNCASPLWRLQFRLIGRSTAGYSWGNASTAVDSGVIAQDIITQANTNYAPGYTGIIPYSASTGASVAAGPYYWKPALELLTEISSSVSGFDFRANPIEPTNVGEAWPAIAQFYHAASIGTSKTEAIFEYGTNRANVTEYTRNVDRSTMLNAGIVLVSGYPDGTGQLALSALDTTSVTNRGDFEGVINDGGITWDTLRQALVDAHVAARKDPKHTLVFKVALNALPSPFDDYAPGDRVRARGEANHVQRFDNMFRVWGMTINLDDNGNEATELELIQPA